MRGSAVMTTTESRTTMKKAVEVRPSTQPRRGLEACVVSGLLAAIRVPPKWASDGHPSGCPSRRAPPALAVRVTGVRALLPLTAGPALAGSAGLCRYRCGHRRAAEVGGGQRRPVSAPGGVTTGRSCARKQRARPWEGGSVDTDLVDRARAGDGHAFGELVGPYRRELQVHCYRILGSALDAEDALQETLLAAWQGLAGFEGRGSLRSWTCQIATRRCLNALRSASRRPRWTGRRPALTCPSLPGSARWSGWSPTPTSCSTDSPTPRPAPKAAMKPPKRSRWPSSPRCSCCRRSSAPC